MWARRVAAKALGEAAAPSPRKGSDSPRLDEAEFKARYLSQFQDAGFDPLRAELDRVAEAAWLAYADERKSARTSPAGPGYADPAYQLSEDWRRARAALDAAYARHDDPAGPVRVLVVSASPRSEHSCPGELSKSWRFAQVARDTLAEESIEVEFLDLSRTTAEYGRQIHPCKACFSTAAALCHWPCSCYPNHSLGQTHDWMNEIYPMWAAAHGVMIVSPVHWYQATSPLKLMIDRLVCADGGNPDPSSTQGKDARRAKAMELEGWPYPRHLEGRLFSVVVHGDAEGAENVRRSLSDWMRAIHMESAGASAELDRYVGYFEPYATSHEALDRDEAVQREVANAARTLAHAVKARRAGRLKPTGEGLADPRPK
jgi:multimeric flavodoxin WrbA